MRERVDLFGVARRKRNACHARARVDSANLSAVGAQPQEGSIRLVDGERGELVLVRVEDAEKGTSVDVKAANAPVV